jgi:hypothetical protein
MASSIETTSSTTVLKNNGNTYLSVDTNDNVALTNPLPVASGGTGVTASTGSGNVVLSASPTLTTALDLSTANKSLDSTGNLFIKTTNGQAADLGGTIGLGGVNGAGNYDPWAFATIGGKKSNSTSGNYEGYFAIGTPNSGGTISEKMRITSTTDGGNVGIGTTAPINDLQVHNNSATNGQIQLTNNSTGAATGDGVVIGFDGSNDVIINNKEATQMKFYTSGAERMRITSGGGVCINTTGAVGAGGPKLSMAFNGGTTWLCNTNDTHGITGGRHFTFHSNGTEVGKIVTTTSATQYITTSDYRLKENVEYDWDATTRLKQLKPARFNFKINPDNTVDGFMAHEAQAVVPESVTGVKDEMADAVLYVKGDKLPKGKKIGDIKEKSKPVMQGIDQAKLVPLLVKTIQELEARIAVLEAKK